MFYSDSWNSFGATLGTAVLVSFIFIKIFSRSKTTSFVLDFWSNIIATFLGLLVSASIFFIQLGAVEKRKHSDLIEMLKAEILDVNAQFSNEGGMTIGCEKNYKINGAFLQPIIFEEAAKTTLFSRNEVVDMLLIARQMHTYNMYMEFLLNTLANGGSCNIIDLADINLRDTKNKLTGNVKIFGKSLGMKFFKKQGNELIEE